MSCTKIDNLKGDYNEVVITISLGQKLDKIQINTTASIKISIQNYATGVYLLMFLNGNNYQTVKVIKQ